MTITLRHRTSALSCLKAKLTKGFLIQEINNGSPLDEIAEILLGSILLGMTEVAILRVLMPAFCMSN